MGAGGVDLDRDRLPEEGCRKTDAPGKEPEGEDQMAGDIAENAWIANIKAMYDSWQSDSQQQARQRQSFQDQANSQYLRWVDDAHTLVMRTADSNAVLQHRAANNAATIDHLINAGEVDTTAQGVAGLKLSEEFRSVAKQAVEAAVAAVPGTSSAAQGTTGVAQGSLQVQNPIELAQVLTNNISVQTALLTTLAEMTKAMAAITVKVTGEATD